MIYVKYLLMVPISLLITLVAIIIAPVLPHFATQTVGWCDNHRYLGIGPRLPDWLSWFQTPDNSLDGDHTFISINSYGYWAQVKWLWRNPAYSYGLKYVSNPYYTKVWGDKTIKDNDNAKAGICFVTANGLFQFRYIKRIANTNRCILVNMGWNIMGLVDDNVSPKPDTWQATFVFSPRLSGFR